MVCQKLPKFKKTEKDKSLTCKYRIQESLHAHVNRGILTQFTTEKDKSVTCKYRIQESLHEHVNRGILTQFTTEKL